MRKGRKIVKKVIAMGVAASLFFCTGVSAFAKQPQSAGEAGAESESLRLETGLQPEAGAETEVRPESAEDTTVAPEAEITETERKPESTQAEETKIEETSASEAETRETEETTLSEAEEDETEDAETTAPEVEEQETKETVPPETEILEGVKTQQESLSLAAEAQQEPYYTQEEHISLYQFGEFPQENNIPRYAASSNWQGAEQAIYNSLNGIEQTLDLSRWTLSVPEVKVMVTNVINHSPELFYVGNSYSVRYNTSGTVFDVTWNYLESDKTKVREMKGAMERRRAEILSRVESGMTDVEKLMVIHDALVMNTTYSMKTTWQPAGTSGGGGCYTAYCVLVEGLGVCHGYALAFSYLASEVGIDTRFVAGSRINHAWNLVLVDGNWYHLDCTWDDPVLGRSVTETVRHNNFLLSDAAIRRTGHSVWDDSSLSSTSTRFDNYYWRELEGPIIKGKGGWLNLSPDLTGYETITEAYAQNGTVYYVVRNASGAKTTKTLPEAGVPVVAKRLVTPITDFSLNHSSCHLEIGESIQLTVGNLTPSDATDTLAAIAWSSSNESVAQVHEGRVVAVGNGAAEITATAGNLKKTCKVTVGAGSVRYQTHVQSIGWQDWKSDGALSGTIDSSKRLESIQICLDGQGYSGGIRYQTHVQSIGWQGWKANGELSGTTNQSKRLEAIQIELTGEMAARYDVYYRVHAQTFGWLDWAKNGESAGTEGLSKRLEAIEIRLVAKNAKAPGNTEMPYVKINNIYYQTHVQTYGWQDYVANGTVSGTEGKSKRLEGIRIILGQHEAGSLEYSTHVQTYGWQDYVSEGKLSGTEGKSKRLEAIKLRLTGMMARQYDVYYRVHVQTYGWLDWAKNGEAAGTEGMSKRLEGIQIMLVPKGGAAPGSTARAYLKR
ncbi:MAG: hypothetical protein HFI63_04680 [Lachnospiraceae bacterium]|nr:hypothetical protein [Lachnospiraceae bacterium]